MRLPGRARMRLPRGRQAQARAAAETVLSLAPGFSAARFVDSGPLKEKAERDKFVAGMVKAGLPE